MRKAGLGVIALGLGSTLHAAPAQLCHTAPEGKWTVSSYWFDEGVVAVSSDEARARVGKAVIITRKAMTFPAYEHCAIQAREFGASDFANYPRRVTYECSNGAVLPSLFVGRGCDKILASLDGANYVLVRRR